MSEPALYKVTLKSTSDIGSRIVPVEGSRTPGVNKATVSSTNRAIQDITGKFNTVDDNFRTVNENLSELNEWVASLQDIHFNLETRLYPPVQPPLPSDMVDNDSSLTGKPQEKRMGLQGSGVMTVSARNSSNTRSPRQLGPVGQVRVPPGMVGQVRVPPGIELKNILGGGKKKRKSKRKKSKKKSKKRKSSKRRR